MKSWRYLMKLVFRNRYFKVIFEFGSANSLLGLNYRDVVAMSLKIMINRFVYKTILLHSKRK
jgi:hypothetical protein